MNVPAAHSAIPRDDILNGENLSESRPATGESSAIADKLSKIDYSKFFNNTWVNAFMMINVLLGLVLLDNYFSNKRNKLRKEA